MSIDVERLSFSYGTHPVLRDVSFRAEPGQLVAVLGPNGAGKSTLFRCMLGFCPTIRGASPVRAGRAASAPAGAGPPGSVYPPSPASRCSTTPSGTRCLWAPPRGLEPLRQPGRQQLETAQRMMELVGIAPLADRGIRRISGGERQLTLIARALAQQARILLMDEPAANLDYGNQFRLLQQVRRLTEQGYTVLLSTHDPEHALRFATHVLALHRRHGGGLRPGGGDADGGVAAHPVPYPPDGGAGAGHRWPGPQLRL